MFTRLIALKTRTRILMTYQCHHASELFSSSFLTLIILDTETAAYFLTVSFITLGNGVVNPPKRSLHFESSLGLTERF